MSGAAVERRHQPAANAQRSEDKTELTTRRDAARSALNWCDTGKEIKPMKRARIKLDFGGFWNEPTTC